MLHSTFIKLYEERTAKGTWEAWRERHKNEPRLPLLGSISHNRVKSVTSLPEGVGSNVETLRAYLVANYESNLPTIKPYPHKISRPILEILMEASGLVWFLKDGVQPVVHWEHKLKEAV